MRALLPVWQVFSEFGRLPLRTREQVFFAALFSATPGQESFSRLSAHAPGTITLPALGWRLRLSHKMS